MTDLYATQDPATIAAVGFCSLTFFWALVRALYRVLGRVGKPRE